LPHAIVIYDMTAIHGLMGIDIDDLTMGCVGLVLGVDAAFVCTTCEMRLAALVECNTF
jgi:hypothetical protein